MSASISASPKRNSTTTNTTPPSTPTPTSGNPGYHTNNSFAIQSSSQSIQNHSPATQPLASSHQPPPPSAPSNPASSSVTNGSAAANTSAAANPNPPAPSTSAERGSNPANCSNVCQVKRKFNATLEQKIFILDWHHANGKKQTKTAAYFTALKGWPTITQPLISNWLKDEEKIRANLKLATPDTKRLRIVRHPEVEKALSVWCNQSIAENFQLGCDLIKIKALEFAIGFGLDQAEFSKSSTCWIDRFLDRQGARTIKSHKAETFTQAGIEVERQRIKGAIAYYAPQDVWTLDETSLYYTMPPDRSVPSDRWRSDQRLLTFGLCVNSNGSQRRPPWIIGKNFNHKSFKLKSTDSLGFDYSANPKASLTAEVFIKWMTTWQKELNKQNRKILLIIDNNPGHIVEADLYPNIRVEFFSSNISTLLQPLDQGIVRVWKAHYRRLFLERAISLYEAKSPNIYQIDLIQAMQLATTAWTSFVPSESIANCWRHPLLTQDSPSGFNSFVAAHHRDKGVAQAESDLSKVIDTLVELGLLNTNNRIAIEEYTDPPFERVTTMQKYTDPEIISFVRNEDSSRDEDEMPEEAKDEKPSIPVPANLAPINGHNRSQAAQNRAPQQINHPNPNLIDGPHHPMFNHHLQHYPHPSHPNLMLHHNHTMHPHNPAHMNAGAMPYIPNSQAGLQKTNDDPIARNGEVWSIPQVLEALEEIGRFSMHRREPEWKELHQQAITPRPKPNQGLNTSRPQSAHSSCATGQSTNGPSNLNAHSTPSRPDHLSSHSLASSLTPSQSNNNTPHTHSQLSIDAITHPVDVNSN
ncbi:hypothetical protein PtA15_6A24 [Puccinia triticina]|uniref:HTH CENPB-type domain-containing protein n=1 Tax=Puccinia triticina TaxID=208348 RepID=A0ABY7CJI4_9BASI|nr:uncharacterized protein PtA15_6A24 [Puccinia triticina]WAQ85396.1 hypothetical protein PtA15_6A24 [Puccinia triticina]